MFIASPIPALMAQFLNNRSSSEENKNTVVQDKDKDILNKSNFSFFGIWVRSFDKCSLIFCQGFCLRGLYQGLPITDRRNCIIICNSNDVILGKYSSHDFALSILNELQDCLLSGFGVFEMPATDIKNYLGDYYYD